MRVSGSSPRADVLRCGANIEALAPEKERINARRRNTALDKACHRVSPFHLHPSSLIDIHLLSPAWRSPSRTRSGRSFSSAPSRRRRSWGGTPSALEAGTFGWDKMQTGRVWIGSDRKGLIYAYEVGTRLPACKCSHFAVHACMRNWFNSVGGWGQSWTSPPVALKLRVRATRVTVCSFALPEYSTEFNISFV